MATRADNAFVAIWLQKADCSASPFLVLLFSCGKKKGALHSSTGIRFHSPTTEDLRIMCHNCFWLIICSAATCPRIKRVLTASWVVTVSKKFVVKQETGAWRFNTTLVHTWKEGRAAQRSWPPIWATAATQSTSSAVGLFVYEGVT